eukprot:SAG31_NODE_16728_length_698_cov_1.098497_1_plen_142_part_00
MTKFRSLPALPLGRNCKETEALPPPPASLGFGAQSWLDLEPTAAVAKRGQLLVHSGAMLHSAWHNPWHSSRKGFLLQMVAKSVRGGLDYSRIDRCIEIYPKLHAALPEGRKHLVPPSCRHFASGYEKKWPETFRGGVTARL